MDDDEEPRWDRLPAKPSEAMPDHKPEPRPMRRALWGCVVLVAILIVVWLIVRHRG